jgi:hypothetical protein
MNSTFFKGLLAAIIACIATAFGVPGASIWYYVIITLGTVIVYFAQNFFVKPISIFGTIDLTDILKGVIMAVGTSIMTYAASIITSTTIDFKTLLSVAGAAILAYLSKNLFSNSSGVIGKESAK